MATRFYFATSGTLPVSTGFDTGWSNTNSTFKATLLSGKTEAAFVLGLRQGWTAAQRACNRQFMYTTQLDSGFVNGTLTCQVAANEFAGNDNSTSHLAARIVTGSGTLRGVLKAASHHGMSAELNSSLRNKSFSSATALTSVTAGRGDYLVVEIGFSDASGTSPEGQARYGAPDFTDYGVNETETTSLVAWVEFSQNLAFVQTGNAVPLIGNLLFLN